MAILPEHPGLEVQVIVDDQPLREYDGGQSNVPNTVTRYIEAVSNAVFRIKFSFTKPFPSIYDVGVRLHLDRKRIGKRVYQKSKLFNAKGLWFSNAESRVSGEGFIQSFQFSQIDTDETDTQDVDEELADRLAAAGQIEAEFFFVKNVRAFRRPPRDRVLDVVCISTVPAKAVIKRALSHQTILGAPQPFRPLKSMKLDFVDKERKPFATFIFKHRSLSVLKSQGIVPATTSPDSGSYDSTSRSGSVVQVHRKRKEDMTLEEALARIEELEEREEATLNIKKKIKQEESGEHEDHMLGAGERSRKRPRVLPTSNDEAIVLD